MKVFFMKKVIICGGCEIHLYRTEDLYMTHIVMVFDPDDNLIEIELVIGAESAESTFDHHVIEQGGDRES